MTTPSAEGQAARRARRVVAAVTTMEGDGMVVRRGLPHAELPALDPFLLLDHMGPRDNAPGEAKGAPDHPHRGFETVTYVLEGAFEHKDSQGNHGVLGPGDVQWMTAGDGVIHSEMPSQEIRERGGRTHGLQLWVNLPRRVKRMQPRYQDIRADRIPEVRFAGGHVRVIAGAFWDAKAVIATETPMTYLHAVLEATPEPAEKPNPVEPGKPVQRAEPARVLLPAPAGHAGFVYVIGGSGNVAGARVEEADMVALSNDGTRVELEAGPAGLSAILVTGVPLREPVVQWGPFVMNTREEIIEAVRDYQAGRMGTMPVDFAAKTERQGKH